MANLVVFARSREKIHYNGPAVSVSSVNAAGRFDVLPSHINFLSLIYDRLIIDTGQGKVEVSLVGEAVMRVYSNNVDVYMSLTK